MRVLFVTHNFPRTSGDLPGNFIMRLAQALRAAGTDVSVVAPHAPGLAMSTAIDGIPVVRYRYASDARETLAYEGTMAAQVRGSVRAKLTLAGMIRAAGRAVRALSADVDVVHAHWWFPSGLAVTTRALNGRPLVTTLHGSDVRLARGRFAQSLMRRVVARSARMTAVSSWLASEGQRLGGAQRVTVAPMPVDVSLFTPTIVSRDGVLFVGKLDEQKGARVWLEALARLPHSISTTIIGDGPDARALHARAASLGVAGRVRWCGALPHEALPPYYRAAQLVVAPATEPEGLGLSAAEAMLCETPVVASRIGGLPDLVEDGETGRLVSAGDPDILAHAVTEALASPERLAQWGATGRARILARMSPETSATAYRSVYEEALGARA